MLSDGKLEPELTPCGQAQGDKKDQLRRLISKAKEDWKAPDHPNWSIRDMDSAEFLDSHLQPGQVEIMGPSAWLIHCPVLFFNAYRSDAEANLMLLWHHAVKPM